ncbi:hypothetical protein [Citrobacter braakii]|uniref:hypothetical protein n=1 Tax=Citrobacter braakii TaxID=57706 RepID=UPI001299D246|nr:hypothetical protein [Citrobacter braakii]MEB8065561.1 hypothetical protein [Citrobacter braakii]MRE78698.1 hypothetical protein [Citrobacter braakii]HBC6262492.1 hypothetical protein [Citrobacter braakii]HBC8730349.1 hypothetical protein [Citrobacter braakii]
MKIIIFISLVTIEMLFLPDAFIYTFVKRFIPISGDGEYAMDNFEMVVLLVKALICAVVAGVTITLFRTR